MARPAARNSQLASHSQVPDCLSLLVTALSYHIFLWDSYRFYIQPYLTTSVLEMSHTKFAIASGK